MIPISLTIKGLYSYQQEQTIDFNRLIEGQLFGIFGSVGSGKSSILEAISFALYGKTERLDSQDNRNYNMMNLKSNELIIDFSFQNYDGQLYRYTVKGKRHGKDFEKVNTFQRGAYHWLNEAWLPLESTSAEKVIGLSYDNFRRTIIIPQGKFQEFLQLGHKDRTQMLKEIFQLEKYEFFYQTRNLENKNNTALLLLKGEFSTYAEIQEEKVVEKQNELIALKNILAAKRQEYELKTEIVSGLAVLKTLMEQLHHQQTLVDTYQKDESTFQLLAQKIKEVEYCTYHFKNGLDLVVEKQENVKRTEENIRQLEKIITELKGNIEQVSSHLTRASVEVEKQDSYKDKLQDYQHLLNLLTLNDAIVAASARIEKGEGVLAAVAKNKEKHEDDLRVVKEEVRENTALMPDVTELVQLRTWFDQKNNLEQSLASLSNDLSHLIEEEKARSHSLYSQLKQSGFWENLSSEENAEEINRNLSAYSLTNRVLHEQIRSNIEHFKVQLRLGEYSDALHRGEACPLCGSLEHVFVLEVENVQQHLEAEELKFKANNDEYSRLQQVEKAVAVNVSISVTANQRLSHVNLQIAEIKSKLTTHLHLFRWTAFDPQKPEVVALQLTQADEIRLKIKSLTDKGNQIENELELVNKSFTRFESTLLSIRQEQISAQAEYNSIYKLLKQHQELDISMVNSDDLRERFEKLKVKIQKDREVFEGLTSQLQVLKEEQLKNTMRLENLISGIKSDEENILLTQQNLDEKFSNSSFSTWGIVKDILSSMVDLEIERENVNAFNQQYYSAKERLADLKLQVNGKVFDTVIYEALGIELANLKVELETMNDHYIAENSLCGSWLKQLEIKRKLLKELEGLEHRDNNLKTMRLLFMANGFVNYISTVYLQNLCEVANERFYRLTRQQLRLELNDKNEFQVRDFMNDGRLRSVKTLSGGQTFQASLCLALALAESVQQQNKSKQNFFFLDEGFGSLDKESLQMAFETLKSLRKEQRIVGVISHVEELQQEIDVYLRIENDTITGSKVIRSWE